MDEKTFQSFFLTYCILLFLSPLVSTQLDYKYYDATCPNLTKIVRYGVRSAIANDTRMAASLLRLHFHDCLVNAFSLPLPILIRGCEGSLLLDETSTIKGEKNALPNKNSVRGYEVIDNIKASLEKACPSTVSCTDIVTLAARDAVNIAGGLYWYVPLGRRDGTTTSDDNGVLSQLPSPFESLENITSKFTSKGLTLKDVVVLSGAHTIGFAQCKTFKRRLFDFNGSGNADPTLDSSLLTNLKSVCPDLDDSDTNLVALDTASSTRFDNSFFKNVANNSGILQSDQALMGDTTTASMVANYSKYPFWFYKDFGASMVKMASLGVLTGQNGEIRKNCRAVN